MPWPLGGDLADLVAVVVHSDGLHPLGLIGGQVLIPQVAAELLAVGVDLLGDLPGVEGGGIGLADGLQGVGVVGQADQIPRLIGPALGGEGPVPLVEDGAGAGLPVLLKGPLPHDGQVGGAGVALPGVADGGGHVLRQGPPAEALCQLGPGLGGAGHRHRSPAVDGHLALLITAVGQQLLDGGRHGGGAAGVEAVELPVLGRPHQGEGVGADAVGGGLHHGEGGGGGHSGVHGVAPLLKGLQTGGGGLGAGAVHHAAPGIDGVALGGIGLVDGIEGRIHRSASLFFLNNAPFPGAQSAPGNGMYQRTISVVFYRKASQSSVVRRRRKEVQSVFPGDMCVGKNTAQAANVRAQRVRCSGLHPLRARACTCERVCRLCRQTQFPGAQSAPGNEKGPYFLS